MDKTHHHAVNDDRKHTCLLCNKSYITKKCLRAHILWKHERPDVHKCDICNKGFPKSNVLRQHIENVHEGLRKFKCEFCERTFSQIGSLDGHLTHKHEGKVICTKLAIIRLSDGKPR